ncbi:cytochrome b5-like heme/steroid binding domain-containing protein [Ilyonectria destructans]|nr:cytochrome b5-like heme/steroid binding domain-containing protein [Ilyonectria destructans]
MKQEYAWSEIRKHSRPTDLHLVIEGKVYDVTKFQHEHPGGEDFLLDQGGTDVTELFKDAGHSNEANAILAILEIGTVKTQDQKGANVASERLPTNVRPVEQTNGGNGALGFSTLAAMVVVCAIWFWLSPNLGLMTHG